MTYAESEATARLAAIVESSADAMIGKTLEGVITTWNAGAERMYGYTPDEIVGRNVSLLIPAEMPEELPSILRRVASGEIVEEYETERIRKSGVVFEVSVTISPIRDRRGTVVGASTVTRDITDRKRAEADLRDLQERLHQAQRLESVGELAGGIAHDFNNLLAGIMNYSALVGDGLVEVSSRLALAGDATVITLQQDIAEIANIAKRAARLTQQLLIFSRRKAFKSEILDVNSIVIDMEKLLRSTIGETIDLETELSPDLPRTEGDRSRIEQVLMNLAVNARDAMSNGGTLRIETATCEITDADYARLNGVDLGQFVRVIVSDTGSGMSQTVMSHAFDPFFTTKDKAKGGGMGLAIVYGIVTDAGGQVVVRSTPGRGTDMEVILPATTAVARPVAEEVAEPPLTSHGEMILLVEDEDTVREPTRRILVNAGYAVLAACGVEEALELAGEHPGEVDLLLTDVVMPGRSGKDLADRLGKTSPQTKVLYMSGYTSDVIGFRAVSEEGVRLIEKPFAADELLRSVRAALDENG